MARVRLRVEIQTRSGEWLTITGDVRTREDAQIVRGRADEGAQVDPSSLSFQLNNRHGRYSPGNPRSPLFRRIGKNTPVRIGVETEAGTRWRFAGEVSSWPVRWDLSGNDVWVEIEAHGILRRLGQSAANLPDVYRRFLVAHRPDAYWPLTDGETSRQGSPVVGQQPMRTYAPGTGATAITYGADWAEGELGPWLDPVARLPEEERGRLAANVRPAPSSRSWAVEFARRGGGFDSLAIAVQGSGTNADPYRTWSIGWEISTSSMFLSIQTTTEDNSSISMVEPDFSTPRAFDDEAHVYRFELSSTNSSSTYRLYMDGATIASGTWSAPALPVRTLTYHWWVPDDDVSSPAELGHVSVWDTNSSSYPTAQESHAAFQGFAGERAAERIIRVCDEADIPLDMVGDPEDSLPMGPQYPDSVLDLLYSAQAVDGGVLYESRTRAGLAYRTLRSKYNRGATLRTNQGGMSS